MKPLVAHKSQESQQYLTFLLQDQEYGVEIFKIREIRGYAPITPIPNVPPHVRGVMNLRGTVLPVIDLRMKFHLPAVEYNKYTVIVIATLADKTVGLLVDAVSDVLTLAQDAIQGAPDFGTAIDTRFIQGVFQSRERLTVALNLEELLTEVDLAIPLAVE
jgi:purine-binding chemotaxis protein CheW